MLEARGIRLTLGGNVVLRGVDLEVSAGESVGIFGPNGAGKTSLLRVLSLQAVATAGMLRMFGRKAETDDLAVRRRIGLLGHDPGIFGGLSGLENLVFYARLYGLRDARKLALGAIEAVGLAAFRHEYTRNYSAGMRQRLGLARALLHDPDILFLDEPHQSLDAAGADLLEKRMRAALSRSRAVVFVSHEIERGFRLADRLVVLRRGRVVWSARRTECSLEEFRTALVSQGAVQ